MSLHVHHRRALWVILVAGVLDLALGAVFGHADRIGFWNGLYFSTSVATTSGNSPYYPHGWPAYLLAVAMHLTMIPLWLAAFSLFTSGLTSDHLHPVHSRLARLEQLLTREEEPGGRLPVLGGDHLRADRVPARHHRDRLARRAPRHKAAGPAD